MKKQFNHGRWFVEYDPDDGARLSRLCFDGFDLMTTEPARFKPPEREYGEYEKRPVYGYDDCFPSVEECTYPESGWAVPDHGELCWLKWDLAAQSDRLIFSVRSKVLPVRFTRSLLFNPAELVWKFEISNMGDHALPFQHVVHPLMKPDDIADLQLPDFESVNDDKGNRFEMQNADEVRDFLFTRKKGDTHMLFIQNAESGVISWTYKNGMRVVMTYPVEHFPAIGIWWNNSGYPDEEGCRRNECAFEPVPGTTSRLTEAIESGHALQAKPGDSFAWELSWKIE